MLSRWDEKVLDSEDGRSENRRDDLVSPELLVLLREKPKEVRRLDSVLCLGAATTSLGMGPAIDVGG